MTFVRWVALVVALGSPLAFSATAHADPTAEDLASARELFKEGRALREKGDLPKAIQKLRAAHALGQTPITGLELAKTYVLVGKLVDAHEVSLGVGRLPVASDETGRSDNARKEAAALASSLAPRLATLVISVKGVPAGASAVVSVDEEVIPPAAIGEPRSANPGPHVVVVTLASGAASRAEVTVKEGESRAVVVNATPSPVVSVEVPPLPTTEPARPTPPPRSNILFVTGATVGGFGLLFGASFGIATFATKGSLSSDCPGGQCGPAHHDLLASAQTDATASTVSFVVAGVGVGVAIVDLLLRPKKEAHARLEPELGPGWIGFHGSF